MRDREREAKEREAGSKRKTGLRQIGAWAHEDQGQMKRDTGTEYSDSFLPGHFGMYDQSLLLTKRGTFAFPAVLSSAGDAGCLSASATPSSPG